MPASQVTNAQVTSYVQGFWHPQFASVAKLTGHDEATLQQIYHHVVGEVVTPEIQAAAD